MAGDVARDNANERLTVDRRDEHHIVGLEALVRGRNHLLFRGQVDPQLNAVEKPTGDDKFFRGRFDVQDAFTRRHPLCRSVLDEPAPALRVLVLEPAVDHVRDRFKSSMGMPGSTFGLAGGVLHFAHLVHVDKRVQVPHRESGEGAANGESLAL